MLSFMKKFCLLVLFISNYFFAQEKIAQEMAVILQNEEVTSTTSDAKKLSLLINLLSKQDKAKKTPELGQLYATIGKYYYKNKENTKAIASLNKAIHIQEGYKKDDLQTLNKTRNNLAWIYSYENKENERYQVLSQMIKDHGTDKYTFNATLDSAVIESKKGDFYAALQRLNVLLASANPLDQEIKVRLVIIGIYGKMYENVFAPKNQSDFQIIKNHQLRIENEFENTDLGYDDLYTGYNNLANVYEAFGDQKQALQFYQKVYKYYTKEKEDYKRLSVLNNIGFLYAKQGQLQLASNSFKEVVATATDPALKATAYDNMGYFLKDAVALNKIYYFQKAIQVLLETKHKNFVTPTLETIRESGYQQDILIYLVDLAYHYVKAYKEEQHTNYLVKARETLYRIDELFAFIPYESITEQSKLFWIEKGVNTYMLAVEVSYLLNKPEEAFYFMEKNKALLLQENIKILQAKLELQMPKDLQEKEYNLHYELIALDKQFRENSNDNALKKEYLKKSKVFQKFMDSLQKKYPKYVKIKEEIETVSLDKVIASTLKTIDSFVTYMLSEEEGYGIFCTQKEKLFFKVPNVTRLQKNIIVLKNYMQQPILTKIEIENYRKIGNEVFIALFPFKNAIPKLSNKKISIVPDDTLINLPFEALPFTTEGKLATSYFINIAEVSYLQSFSVFEKIKGHKNNPTNKLLAMAPYQFENKKLEALVRSKEAISALNTYQSATVLVEEQATKANFYQYSSTYDIIHLNTHAGIDSSTETPWISFRKDKLTLDELYGMDNQAALVILDACKTNAGTFASGEGILSLSRGFFYNGSKSVVASLWNVNEKAGNEILTTFYTGLEQGNTKSKALQFAKIKYLKKHQFTEVLPFYWASFTLTGSTAPIELSKKYFQNSSILVIVSSLLLVLFFIYYMRKLFLTKQI